MSRWKEFLVVNGGIFIGLGISLFVMPGYTPLWLWAAVAAVFLIVANFLLSTRRQSPTVGTDKTVRTMMIAISLAFLLIDLLVSEYFR